MSGLGHCTVILYFISCSNRFGVALFIKLSIALSQRTNNMLLLFALNILIYTQVSVLKSEKIFFFFSSLSCFDVVKKKLTVVSSVFQCFMFGALLLHCLNLKSFKL